jgi:MYXO-CTERM domain-containing protein
MPQSALRLTFALVCCSTLSSGLAAAAPVWSDPLTGPAIDAAHWTSEALNADVKLAPSDMGVVMTVAGSAHGADFLARLTSLCTLVGDFDIQVDYQLGPWPAHSGVRLALVTGVGSAFGSHAGVERVSLSDHDVVVQTPGTEVYLADFLSLNPFPDMLTTDLQGTIRLTRTGNSQTAYFSTAGGAWTTLYMAATTDAPVFAALQTWSDDQFFDTQSGGSAVTFRNYVVSSGQLDCPGTSTPDGSAGDATSGDATSGDTAMDTASSDAAASDGGNTPARDNGCRCDLGSEKTPAVGAALLGLAALAMLRQRRRRGRE